MKEYASDWSQISVTDRRCLVTVADNHGYERSPMVTRRQDRICDGHYAHNISSLVFILVP